MQDPTLVTDDPDLKYILDKVDWIGAKLGGSLSRRNDCFSFDCSVRSNKHFSKSFSIAKYGSREQAYNAAVEFQREICYRHGWTTNNYGFYVNDVGQEVGIVKLTRKKFMFFSRQHLPLVLAHSWHAYKCSNSNCWYASASIKNGERFETFRFHSLVLPEAEMIDHIDHNGLNNMATNLRPANNQLNAYNTRLSKANTSGYKGISLITKKRSGLRYWQASVMENGKSHGKQFSVRMLGEDGALNAALAHRDMLFEKYGVFPG